MTRGRLRKDPPQHFTFATTFHRHLLAGASFVDAADAVAAAREAAWTESPGGKNWAAYQCLGDPGWTSRAGVDDAQGAQRPVGDEYAGIASAVGLTLALEELAVTTRWSGAEAAAQLQKVQQLEVRFGAWWSTRRASCLNP